jgi:hypothetical protein
MCTVPYLAFTYNRHCISISSAYCTVFEKVFNNYFQTSVTAQQESLLSQSHPFIKFGNTVVKLQDESSKKRRNEHVSEPRLKVRRFDDLSLELGSEECNGIGSPLPSPSLADDDNENTQTPQQVSQLGLPGEDLPAHNMAPSNQMYVGATASAQQQFGTSGIVSELSSVGQLVGNIPTSTGATLLGTVRTVSNVGTLMESPSSSGMAVTLNDLSGISNQYVISSPVDSAVPVIIQQPLQSTVSQSQVYISDSAYSLAAGKLDGLITDSLHSASELECQTSLLLKNNVAKNLQGTPQPLPSQHEQAQWHQQHSSLKNGETTVPSHAGVEKPKNQDILNLRPAFPSDNAQLKGSKNLLITTCNNVIPPQQQKGFPVNISPTLVGKIGARTVPLLQLPTIEARQIAAVPSKVQGNTCQISVSDAIQNSSPIGANQQVADLESGHLPSRYDCKNIY